MQALKPALTMTCCNNVKLVESLQCYCKRACGLHPLLTVLYTFTFAELLEFCTGIFETFDTNFHVGMGGTFQGVIPGMDPLF